MPRVTAIMPCLGRVEQTLELIPRLLATAEYADWRLVCIADDDAEVYEAIYGKYPDRVFMTQRRFGYWKCLRAITLHVGEESELFVNLANDLLPGRGWLGRAVQAFDAHPPGGHGVIGFNDGVWNGQHAAHFLVDRVTLRAWYGEDYWPVCYRHMYGDTEICERAKAAGRFYVEPYAVLFHNHKLTGAQDDEVYKLGESRWKEDQALFEERRKQWSN